jgi:hypothetical protein
LMKLQVAAVSQHTPEDRRQFSAIRRGPSG